MKNIAIDKPQIEDLNIMVKDLAKRNKHLYEQNKILEKNSHKFQNELSVLEKLKTYYSDNCKHKGEACTIPKGTVERGTW